MSITEILALLSGDIESETEARRLKNVARALTRLAERADARAEEILLQKDGI